MKYTQLTTDAQDAIIAEAMYGRELEHFHHALNVANYAALLPTLDDGPWRERIQQLHDEALVEMAKIEGLHAALSAQLTDTSAIDRAMHKRG